MAEKFKTSESLPVTISHCKLIAPVAGFAIEGMSEYGTSGTLIFIPTKVPQSLINLLRV